MTATLLAFAILLSPQLEGGLGMGGGFIDEHAALTSTPWFAVTTETASVAIQAPVLIHLDSGRLRRRDWDEPGDYAKLLRRITVGPWFHMGPLRDRTIGNGSIVRRYHNGTDPDHGRLALDLHADLLEAGLNRFVPNHLEAFADQVLDAPVFGSAIGYQGVHNFALITIAGDFAAPKGPLGPVDDIYIPQATRHNRWAAGLSGRVRTTSPKNPLSIDIHGDMNVLNLSGYGGHFGLAFGYQGQGLWTLNSRLEGMILGSGYTWSLFDHGYLIDRWTGLNERLDETDFALGGRLDLQFGYANAFIFGGQFANCSQTGRADLSAFLRVPMERTTISAFWRVRGPEDSTGIFEVSKAMTAMAARFELTSPLSAQIMVARDWRVSIDREIYRPTTTAMLSLDVNWSSQ